MSHRIQNLFAASVITASALIAGCASVPQAADSAHCLPRPALFTWQALDDASLLIWPNRGSPAREIALAHPIDGLSGNPPGLLELIDGDHDGEICSEGFDSVALWSDGSDADTNSPMPVGEASVYFVENLNALGLAERLEEHAATHGPLAPDRVMDE